MAESIALHRALESEKPEAERICYDPYAVRFVDLERLRAFEEALPRYERFIPGLGNSVIARVRYFDDFVAESLDNGLEQLIILGAGYDTRAYRIKGLKERVKVFEVDHAGTQIVKKEKIREIFGFLPDHVRYVSVDFEKETLGQKMMEKRI